MLYLESLKKVIENMCNTPEYGRENDEMNVPAENPLSIEHNEIKNNYTQWLVEGNSFYAIGKTIKKLIPGFYKIKYDNRKDAPFLKKQNLSLEKVINLPDPTLNKVIKDINKFWNSKETYEKYQFTYKRGFLLYGPPGCGKTSIIQLLTQTLINEHKGVIISISDVDELRMLDEMMEQIKTIEPETKLILIFEDIDNFTDSTKYEMSKLLNILDGNFRIENTVIIATTNYPEKLQERISNRPSRFDIRCEIKVPTDEIRKYYIENFLTEEDLKDKDVEKIVKDTEGFTIDHLKELILSTFVLDKDYDFALDEINNMRKNGTIKPTPLTKPGNIGFTKTERG